MSDLPLKSIETKLAFLERHIEEQDKEILKLVQTIEILTQKIQHLEERQKDESGSTSSDLGHEKPPHY